MPSVSSFFFALTIPAFPAPFPVGKAQSAFLISRLLMKDSLEALGEDGVTRVLQVEVRAHPPSRVPVLNTWTPGDGKRRMVMLGSPYTGLVAKNLEEQLKSSNKNRMCLHCPCSLPYKKEGCRGALETSRFPFSSPCLPSCSIRLSLPTKGTMW